MRFAMPDLLVRGIDPEVFDRMRKAAAAQGKSLAQTAREALGEKFRPSRSKEEIWAEADRIRMSIGRVSGDSTKIIRRARDGWDCD
jgi:plasmid stability protein